MVKLEVFFFTTGYCTAFENIIANNKPWKQVRFQALVALIQHPHLGPILFDTGYSSHVIAATRRFPYSLYRIITPMNDIVNASQKIEEYSCKADDIRHVIISHFHADHIGGLKDFSKATFHYLPHAYEAIRNLKHFAALRKGFLPDLIPADFVERSHVLSKTFPMEYFPFNQGYDIFGDQSLIAIELSGHATGQLGLLFKTKSRTFFLCADACWQSSSYRNLEFPNWIGRQIIDDFPKFSETLSQLHSFSKNYPELTIVPSHCSEIWDREDLC